MILKNKLIQTVKSIPRTFSLQNTKKGTFYNGSITMPTGIVSGDILLIMTVAGASSTSTPTIATPVPTGFTALTTLTGTYSISTTFYRNTTVIYFKLCDGSESGAVVTNFLNSSQETYTLYHVRGVSPATGVAVTSVTTAATAANPPQYSLTTTSASDTIVWYSAAASAAPTVNPTPTPTATQSQNASMLASLNTGIWLSKATATYIFDANDAGDMNLPTMGSLRLVY